MYRQIKGICTCIFLYVSITCTNGLLCYSCFGYEKNALDCKIITCKRSLFDDTACYYEVFQSGYQHRGCGEMKSVLPQLIKGNINPYYCQEDYCNGYFNEFISDTRRQYKSRETQAPYLKPSWNSIDGANIFIIIMVICVMGALIYLCCSIMKSTYEEASDSFLNTNTAGYRTANLEYRGNNRNYYSHVSYNISRSNHHNYRDDLYIYGDTNCDGGNDLVSGVNDDSDGDRGAGDCYIGDNAGGDCCGGDSGGGDCGGGDYGGGDCGGGDYGGGDCGGGDYGGGDCGGGDYGGGDCGGGDYGGGDCGGGGDD